MNPLRNCWFCLVAVLVGGMAPALEAAEVAHWSFDADLSDVSGGNDLIGQGGIAVTTAVVPARRVGAGALVLDGADDFAAVVDDAALDVKSTGLSVSAWINLSSHANFPRIFEKGTDNEYRLFIELGSTLSFEILGIGKVSIPVPSTGTWHHVVGVWDPTVVTGVPTLDNGAFRFYLDGVLVQTTTANPNPAGTVPAANTGDLAVGAKPGGTDLLHGSIDDLRIFDAPLDLAGVRALIPPATALVFSSEPAGATAGAAFTTQPVVRTVDVLGYDTFTGLDAAEPLTIAVQSGGAFIGSPTTVIDVGTASASPGIATFTGLRIDLAGPAMLQAAITLGAVETCSSQSFTVVHAAPAKVVFVQEPTSALAGAALSPAVTVEVRDDFDNPISGSTASVTVAIANNAGGSTLGGTTSVAAAAGVASFADLTLNKSGSGYTVSASASGLVGDTSAAFTISAAALNQMVFTTQPVDSVAGAAIPLAVELRDAFGNLTGSTAAVTIAIGTNPGGGTLAGTATVNAVAGVATFSDLSIASAGSGYTLVATSTVPPAVVSDAFAITPAVADHLAIVTGPTDAVVGLPQADDVEVEIRDVHGNRVTGATDTVDLAFGANPGSATLGGTTSVAAVAGLAVFPGLTVSAVGANYTLVATSGSLPAATSNTFDVTVIPGGGGSGGGSNGSSSGCGLGSVSGFAALLGLMLVLRLRLHGGRRHPVHHA